MKKKMRFCVVGALGVALGCVAEIFGQAPFGEASVLVGVCVGLPVWIALPVYLAVTVAREQSQVVLWSGLACTAGALGCALLTKKRKWLTMLWYAVARLGEIGSLVAGTEWWLTVSNVLLGGVATAILLACRRNAKFTPCGAMLASMMMGAGAHVWAVLGAFGVGFWVYFYRRDEFALKTGACYLLGGLVATQSLQSFAVGVVALVVGAAAVGRTWRVALCVAIAYAVASLVVGEDGLLPCAGATVGCVLGAVLPRPKECGVAVLPHASRLARTLRQSASACRGMEMSFDGEIQDVGALTGAFALSLCAGCPSARGCEVAEEAFLEAVRRTVESGKVGFECIPDVFVERCCRAADVPQRLGAMLLEREHDVAQCELRATAHALVSSELKAFSGLLMRMACIAEQDVLVDGRLGRALSLALGEQVEVARLGQSVCVRAQGASANAVERALFEVQAVPYMLDATQVDGQEREYVFAPKPALAVSYGVAQANKNTSDVCGDTYAVRRLGASVVIAVLCDGMGSGKSARLLSERTVDLLESCFSAGFTTAEILPMVNFLLHLGGERFSCVDVCVCDLAERTATFVKMGSVESYLVRGDEVFRIDGESLPLGVESVLSPSVATVAVQAGDLIVLNSDGVSDVLEKPFASGRNPQDVAQGVLERALLADGGIAHDDMTTLVLRAV